MKMKPEMRSSKMEYKFTVKDLEEITGHTGNLIRHRLLRLIQKGLVRNVSTSKSVKVYVSNANPLELLELKEKETIPIVFNKFWHNPFNLKNAIDMRWHDAKNFIR
jgi:hypothetical protein